MSSEIIYDLIKQAQKGNVDAFGEVYSLYKKELYRFAYYWTSSSTLAEDAVSETVICAFENIRRLRNAESFRPWIFKILFNCCKQKQKEKVIAKSNVPLENVIHIQAFSKDSDLSFQVREALDILSPDEKKIVILSLVCGYKSEEVGEMMGMKASTVRSKLSRASEKLRKILINSEKEAVK